MIIVSPGKKTVRIAIAASAIFVGCLSCSNRESSNGETDSASSNQTALAETEPQPMVALHHAKEEGTSIALRQVIKDYPGTSAAEEANTELPEVLLREAQAANSVSAYRKLIAEFPNSREATAAHTEIHTLYKNALDDFREQAAQGRPQLVQLMEKLAAYLERSDSSTVEVRYRDREDPETKNTFITYSPSTRTETEVMNTLQKCFAAFNHETLSLHEGSAITDVSELNRLTAPTIFLEYKEEMNNTMYKIAGQADPYFGTDVSLKGSVKIPGESNAFGFSVLGRTPSRFSKYSTDIFTAMTDLAVDQMLESLGETFISGKAAVPSTRRVMN